VARLQARRSGRSERARSWRRCRWIKAQGKGHQPIPRRRPVPGENVRKDFFALRLRHSQTRKGLRGSRHDVAQSPSKLGAVAERAKPTPPAVLPPRRAARTSTHRGGHGPAGGGFDYARRLGKERGRFFAWRSAGAPSCATDACEAPSSMNPMARRPPGTARRRDNWRYLPTPTTFFARSNR
jgi:hypothetical protein